jgi:hypothetical protein
MDTDDFVDRVLTVSSVACFLFSVVIACRKLPPVDRFFPVFWQIVLGVIFFLPFTHGFPAEEFRILIFTTLWSIPALVVSYRLYGIPARLTQVFAFLQFVETVCVFLQSALHYISACWRYYGHIV